MKLSSKLLIVLGVAVLAIPLLTASYIESTDRVDGQTYTETLNKEAKDPHAKDVYLKTVQANPFNKITITGEGARWIEVHLIESKEHAVKMGKNDQVKMEVRDGILHIGLLKTERYFTNILYIFAPQVNTVKLTDVTVSDFFAKQPYLQIIGDRIQDFSFNEDSKIQSLDMELKGSHLGSDYRPFPKKGDTRLKLVNRFDLKLDSCEANLLGGSTDTLNLYAKDSKLSFSKVRAQTGVLDLHTVGQTNVALDSLTAGEIKGQLSDQTTTDMPVHLLRKLLK